MKNLNSLTKLGLLLFLLYLIIPQRAEAYIDPGSGSYIIQVIVAAILGSLFSIKIFFKQIKSFFVNLFSKKRGDKKD